MIETKRSGERGEKNKKFQIDYRLHPYWKTVALHWSSVSNHFDEEKKNEFRSRRGRCNNHNHSATCHTNEMLRAPHSDDLVLRHITSITNQMQRYKNWYKSYFCIVLFSESRWMRDLSRFEATAYCKQRLHCRKVFSRCRKKTQWIYRRVDAIVKYSLNTFRNIIISLSFAVILFSRCRCRCFASGKRRKKFQKQHLTIMNFNQSK